MQNLQLPLGIRLREGATFDGYYAGPNHLAVEAVRACLSGSGESLIYLWGAAGVGKSHLLQAACHEMGVRGEPAAYLPLDEIPSPAMLEGLESMPLVCLDALEAVAGDRDWEEALFHLYNRLREAGGRLLVAARARPAELALNLADLVSRLNWGLTFQLQTLDDEEKLEVLYLHAQRRGLVMPEEVGRYLIRREARDLPVLLALLDTLDQASLAAQRRLTVPFVKDVLAAG